jgi:LacI family transcriptional regulator, repressor for deo operon, udp, cdd, tsx, nupC, and nupG
MNNEPSPKATIDDVARAAGVSTATVSRALRNHPHVAEPTRRRVIETAERMRYVANASAARLASGRTRTVGLIAPLLTTWYSSEVIAGVEEVLTRSDLDLLIGTANRAVREGMFRGDARFKQQTDGIILLDVFCGERGARQLARLGAPLVVLGERLDAVTSVSVDNAHGARLAARHLIALGHRRIGLVSGHDDLEVARNVPFERRAGFEQALQAAGIRLPDRYVVDGAFTIDGGRRAMGQLLDLDAPPTAVFFLSDEMAFGALRELRDRGLEAGRDVSIVGFDDHPVSNAVGLTTVAQPVREIGRVGARLLVDALDGFASGHHHPIDVALVVRETTTRPSLR